MITQKHIYLHIIYLHCSVRYSCLLIKQCFRQHINTRTIFFILINKKMLCTHTSYQKLVNSVTRYLQNVCYINQQEYELNLGATGIQWKIIIQSMQKFSHVSLQS